MAEVGGLDNDNRDGDPKHPQYHIEFRSVLSCQSKLDAWNAREMLGSTRASGLRIHHVKYTHKIPHITDFSS